MNTSRVLSALILGSMLSLTGCKKEDAEEAISDSTAGGITAGTIAKSWSSNCLTDVEPITSSNRVIKNLDINSDGSFNYYEEWYSGGSCLGANATVVFWSSGTFAIGSSTSSDTVAVTFTVTDSDLMPMSPNTTTTQAAFNLNCGMTSPFDAGQHGVSSGNAGHHYQTFGHVTCSSMNMPNSGFNIVENLVTYSNGNLVIGVGENGVPGVFNGPAPSSTSTYFH